MTARLDNRFTIIDIVFSFVLLVMGALLILEYEPVRGLFTITSLAFAVLSVIVILKFDNPIARGIHVVFLIAFLLPVIWEGNVVKLVSRQMAIYFILTSIIQLFAGRVYMIDDIGFGLKNIVKGLVSLAFSLAMFKWTIDSALIRFVLGLRLVLTGLHVRKPIMVNHPVIFDVCLPYFMKTLYPASQVRERCEDEEKILKIRIGTGAAAIDFVGHTELTFKGMVYTFGNYNIISRQFFNMYGDGIITKAPEESMDRFARIIGQTVFEYIIKLTDEEFENVSQRMEALMDRAEEWQPKKMTSQHRVMKRITRGEAYRVENGPASHYFVLAMNCVTLTNYVTKEMEIPKFGFAEVPVPGTTLYLLDKAYRQSNQKILARNILKGDKA